MTDIGIKGGPELLEFLGAFVPRLQKGAVRAGMVAAARPVRDQARVNVSGRSRRVAKAIKTGSPRVNQDGTVSIKISLRNKGGRGNNAYAFLGVIFEGGAKFYPRGVVRWAGRKRARSTKFKTDGTKGFGRYPAHAAVAAHPFMAPALEGRAIEAINAFGGRVRSYLKDKASFTAPVTIEADDS